MIARIRLLVRQLRAEFLREYPFEQRANPAPDLEIQPVVPCPSDQGVEPLELIVRQRMPHHFTESDLDVLENKSFKTETLSDSTYLVQHDSSFRLRISMPLKNEVVQQPAAVRNDDVLAQVLQWRHVCKRVS